MARLSISSRSKWKGVFSKTVFGILVKFYKSNMKLKSKKYFYISRKNLFFFKSTKSRASVVLFQHVGLKIKISNGRGFSILRLTTDHIGHRFGEFNYTTQRGSKIHKKNLKNKK